MSKPCPIQTQIENSNETISNLRERIRRMEKRLLDSPELPEARRQALQTEIREISKLLETNEENLHKLHRENSKSFAIAACLFFICFLLYGIYTLVYGV